MSSGNDATVDLKADPKGIEEGTGKAKVAVGSLEKAFKDLTKELARLVEANRQLEKSDRAVEEQQRRHRETVQSLTGIVKSHALAITLLIAAYVRYGAQLSTIISVSARVAGAMRAMMGVAAATTAAIYSTGQATGILSVAFGKAVVQWVAAKAVLGPYALAAAVAAVALKATAGALDRTGQKVEQLSDKFLIGNKIMEETGGKVDKVRAKLKELGITAEEAGLKIVTNWTKIEKATDRLLEQGAALSYWKDALDEAGRGVDGFSKKVGEGFTFVGTKISDTTVTALDELKILLKGSRDIAAELLGGMMGVDEKTSGEESRGKSEQKKFDDINRLKAAQADFSKESIARDKERYQLNKTEDELKLTRLALQDKYTLESIKKELAEHDKLKKVLIDADTFKGAAGDKWLKTLDLIKERNEEIKAQEKAKIDLAMQIGEVMANTVTSLQNQKELDVINISNKGTLLAMLEDIEQELRDLQKNQDGEDYEKKQIAALERYRALKQKIAEKEKEDSQAQVERDLAAAETLKQARLNNITLEEERYQAVTALEHTKALELMKLGGATEKELHEQRMKWIDEEGDHNIALAEKLNKTEAELDKIRLQETLARAAEVNAFEIQQLEKAEKTREKGFVLNDARTDAEHRLKMTKLDIAEAKLKAVYEAELAQIKKLEERDTDRANSKEEKENIKLAADKERIKLKNDFEIAEAREAAQKIAEAKKQAEMNGEEYQEPQKQYKNEREYLADVKIKLEAEKEQKRLARGSEQKASRERQTAAKEAKKDLIAKRKRANEDRSGKEGFAKLMFGPKPANDRAAAIARTLKKGEEQAARERARREAVIKATVQKGKESEAARQLARGLKDGDDERKKAGGAVVIKGESKGDKLLERMLMANNEQIGLQKKSLKEEENIASSGKRTVRALADLPATIANLGGLGP